MKSFFKLSLFIIFCFTIKTSSAQAPFWNWAVSAGGDGSDRAGAIIHSADGNFLVTGYYQDSAMFESTVLHTTDAYGMFIAKYNTNGNLIWVRKTAQGSAVIEPKSIYEDDLGNILISGYFGEISVGGTINFFSGSPFSSFGNRDAFLAKFDSSGTTQWARHIGSADEDVMVAAGNNGSIVLQAIAYSHFYLTGSAGYDSLAMDGKWRMVCAQYNTNGEVTKLASVITNTSFMTPQAICADDAGMIYLSGMYYDHPYAGIIPDTAYFESAPTYTNVYLLKLDTISFHRQWQQKFGGSSSDDVHDMKLNTNHSLVITGSYTANADFGMSADSVHLTAATGANEMYLCAYDTAGVLDFAVNAAHSTGGAVTPYSFAQNDSTIYVVGHYGGHPHFGTGADTFSFSVVNNFFVAAYTDTGTLRWARGSQGSFSDGLNGVALDDSSNVYPAGYYAFYLVLDTSATDTINLTSVGVEDILFGRLGYPPPVIVDTTDTSGTGTLLYALVEKTKCLLYPNPSSNELNVYLENNSSPLSLSVFDLAGREMKHEIFPAAETVSFCVNDIASGNYFIQVKTTDKIFSGKFTVVKE